MQTGKFPGSPEENMERQNQEGPTEEEKQHGAEVHRQAAEVARQANIMLAVECLNRFECYFLNTLDAAAAYARQVNHPNFGIMYDTFHANIEERELGEAVRMAAGRLWHVHLADSNRWVPGHGHLRFDEVWRALHEIGYEDSLVIEAFPKPDIAAWLGVATVLKRQWNECLPDRETGS